MCKIVGRIIKAIIPNKFHKFLLNYWNVIFSFKNKRDLMKIVSNTRKWQLEAIKNVNKEKITCVFLVAFEQTRTH